MNSKRLYQLLVGLVGLSIIGLVSGAALLNNMLSKQAATLSEQRQQIAVLDGQQIGLNTPKRTSKSTRH